MSDDGLLLRALGTVVVALPFAALFVVGVLRMMRADGGRRGSARRR